jgi:hypothetical protein
MSEKAVLHNEASEVGVTDHSEVTGDFAESATDRIQSLGSVRLRSATTGAIVLVPAPTKDPNDPLVYFLLRH